MMRTCLLFIAAVAMGLLAGCPIPQSVPEYPKGTSVTPPRIVAESAVPQATLIRVPVHCDPDWAINLSATFVDEDLVELVVARWFTDYVPDLADERSVIREEELIDAIVQVNENQPDTSRPVTPYTFHPYGVQPPLAQAGLFPGNRSPGITHVVELVISNGFAPDPAPGDPPAAMPNRTPLEDFETQVYRWTFLLVDDPTLPCPPDAPVP